MEDNLVNRAIAKAIGAFGAISETEVQKLPLLDSTIILNALPGVATLARIRRQIAERLRQQLTAPWIETGGDTFEVFSVLTALWQYDSRYVTGDQLATAVQRLLKSEVAEGGPYYSGGAVTVAANAQIALFMRLVAKPLPNVSAYLDAAVAKRHFEATELTAAGLLYLLSKASANAELSLYVTGCWQQGPWQTPERMAIALGILKDEAQATETRLAIRVLCRTQQSNGFWAGEPILKTTPAQASSYVVTTALVVEALTSWERRSAVVPALGLDREHDTTAESAKKLFDTFAEPLRSSARAAVDHVCSADKNFEIMLLPHFFAEGLNVPVPLTRRQEEMLSLANIYCWIAYTIYDDFLDDEGEPSQLPVANIALRASLDCYRAALLNHKNFQQLTARVFTAMDEANAWEVNYCRFTVGEVGKVAIGQLPEYGTCNVLATRALAHVLGPMAVLAQGSITDRRGHHVESAFRHYLIARQLNDDMYDWQQDMRAGRASYVVTTILHTMQIKPGTYDLSVLIPEMQKCFRRTTMPKIAQRILRHINISRRAFAESRLLRTKNDVYALLDALALSAKHSLDEYAKGHAFSARLTDSFFEQNKNKS